VLDSIKTLDEKIGKTIIFHDDKNVERLEKSFKELGNRIIVTNNFVNDKFDDMRKQMTSFDIKLSNVATIEKLNNLQST